MRLTNPQLEENLIRLMKLNIPTNSMLSCTSKLIRQFSCAVSDKMVRAS